MEAGTHVLDGWYINIQDPIRRTAIGYDTMDHMLDIVVSQDMAKWYWKDEDEFLEAEVIGFYSHEKMKAIRAAGERALALLTSERTSFYRKWESWCPDPAWKMPQLSRLWDQLDVGLAAEAR